MSASGRSHRSLAPSRCPSTITNLPRRPVAVVSVRAVPGSKEDIAPLPGIRTDAAVAIHAAASNKVGRTPRFLILAAALLMIGAYLFPLWTVRLTAPQYPEGLGMHIR